MPGPQQLPASRLARFLEYRGDPQALPKLAQPAQNGGFGELPAEDFPRFGGSQHPLLVVFIVLVVQCLPQLEHQGRDLVAGRFFRSVLPIGIRTQAEDIGQRLRGNEKIRLLADGAKQVERHHGAGFNQPGEQRLGLGNCVAPRGRRRGSQHGFHKGRRGRRQLRAPRKVEAQRVLFEPVRGVVQGENGVLLLAPMRRSCSLKLLCCQV
jgi:hypothetical protein